MTGEWILLFVVGAVLGSFLNVVALRYDPDGRVFAFSRLRGRSHCPGCGKELCWYELIPIVSFIIQGGRCIACKMRISLQYPLVELFSGFSFAFIPITLHSFYEFEIRALVSGTPVWFYILSALFICAALTLILIAAIDFRLRIIPDSLNFFIGILGIGVILTKTSFDLFGQTMGSFLGHYAIMFGLRESIWVNHLVAGFFGLFFFGAIVVASRGRGMGLGDVKLAFASGLLLGFPDIVLATFLAFITGAFAGILLIIGRKQGMKSLIPFGPFIVLGIFLTITFGLDIMQGYFTLFRG